MGNQRIRVAGKRRVEPDVELIARALLKVAETLDPETRTRLTEEGAALSKQLDDRERRKPSKETAARVCRSSSFSSSRQASHCLL